MLLHSSSDLYGGSKIFFLAATLLQSNGHKITVVLSESGPLSEKLEEVGIPVRIIRLGVLRRKYFSFSGLINRVYVVMAAYKALKRIVRSERVDLVYSNTIGVLVGGLLAKILNVRHVIHIHEIIEHPRLFVIVIGAYLKYFGGTGIVVSKATYACWKKYSPTQGLHLIYNGIDYNPYTGSDDQLRKTLGYSHDDIVVGMVARVSHWKGQPYFLQIAEVVRERCPQVKFLLAGDPYPGNEHLLKELYDQINELSLNGVVKDLGFRSDIPEVLGALDVFVLPSLLPDPFPTTVLEAMASGLPVVATAHGGAREMVVDGESGFLVPWDDPKAVAEKIISLIADEKLRMDMGKKAATRVQEFFSKRSFDQQLLRLIDTIFEK